MKVTRFGLVTRYIVDLDSRTIYSKLLTRCCIFYLVSVPRPHDVGEYKAKGDPLIFEHMLDNSRQPTTHRH